MSAQSRYFSFHVAKIRKISITCKYFCRKMQQKVLKYLKMGMILTNYPHFVICSLHFSYLNAVSDICRIIYREMLLMQKNTSSAEKYVFFCQTLLFLSDAFYIMPPIPGAAAGAAGAGSGMSTIPHSVDHRTFRRLKQRSQGLHARPWQLRSITPASSISSYSSLRAL